MKKIFGIRLRQIRLKEGEEQAELAKIVGVGASMISQWETGRHYPEVSKLIEIAEHYKVSIDYLVGLSDEE